MASLDITFEIRDVLAAPATGDTKNITLYIILMAAALVIIAGCVIFAVIRKRKK